MYVCRRGSYENHLYSIAYEHGVYLVYNEDNDNRLFMNKKNIIIKDIIVKEVLLYL